MHGWLDRLMRRENWMAAAVRHGFEAFARESLGGAQTDVRGDTGDDREPRTAGDARGTDRPLAEAAPSIP